VHFHSCQKKSLLLNSQSQMQAHLAKWDGTRGGTPSPGPRPPVIHRQCLFCEAAIGGNERIVSVFSLCDGWSRPNETSPTSEGLPFLD